MQPGEFNCRAVLQTFAETGRNALNEPTGEWQPVRQIWARRTDMSDQERLSAGAEDSARLARFVFRLTPGFGLSEIDAAMRLMVGTRVWNIKGIKEVAGADGTLAEITAVTNHGG